MIRRIFVVTALIPAQIKEAKAEAISENKTSSIRICAAERAVESTGVNRDGGVEREERENCITGSQYEVALVYDGPVEGMPSVDIISRRKRPVIARELREIDGKGW